MVALSLEGVTVALLTEESADKQKDKSWFHERFHTARVHSQLIALLFSVFTYHD